MKRSIYQLLALALVFLPCWGAVFYVIAPMIEGLMENPLQFKSDIARAIYGLNMTMIILLVIIGIAYAISRMLLRPLIWLLKKSQ